MQLQSAMDSKQPKSNFGKDDGILQRISDRTSQPGSAPKKSVLSDLSGSWTYAQLANVTEDLESWLIYVGIRPGDRVVIVSENCRLSVAILFALCRLEACPVLVSACVSSQDLDRLIQMKPARRILYVIKNSPGAKMHAMRHQGSIIDPVDWGPIAISALNESAEPDAVETAISNRVPA
jgi:long-chain acyl-CoA synthetase